jgi:predicted nucleic acid-binding protein
VRFLLDTNVISDLVRHPRGRVADRIAQIGEQHVCTSIIVAAESRYGAARKDSARLAAQLEAVLRAPDLNLGCERGRWVTIFLFRVISPLKRRSGPSPRAKPRQGAQSIVFAPFKTATL